jgi:predicted ester cyclase
MEAENALEMDRALATFSHPRYEIIGTGETFDGAEEVSRYYRESRAAFPDQRNELISLRHGDDAVIVEFWLLGTHNGPLGRLEPTGRDFKCRMTAFFIFDGTHLVCERVYFDSATIRRQLTGAT